LRTAAIRANRADNAPLPTPAERPAADVLIFDGHCPLCTAGMRLLHRWDRGGRLAFLPLDDAQVAQRWPQLHAEDLLRQIHLIDSHGQIYRGAAVFRLLSRRLPALWAIAPLLHLPLSLPLWQGLYHLLARARYRFDPVAACQGKECRMHGGD
jgi:predicted DCC family thiol-disulfide oxidoreductase YuxK